MWPWKVSARRVATAQNGHMRTVAAHAKFALNQSSERRIVDRTGGLAKPLNLSINAIPMCKVVRISAEQIQTRLSTQFGIFVSMRHRAMQSGRKN
jgi:hypothetical protein